MKIRFGKTRTTHLHTLTELPPEKKRPGCIRRRRGAAITSLGMCRRENQLACRAAELTCLHCAPIRVWQGTCRRRSPSISTSCTLHRQTRLRLSSYIGTSVCLFQR